MKCRKAPGEYVPRVRVGAGDVAEFGAGDVEQVEE